MDGRILKPSQGTITAPCYCWAAAARQLRQPGPGRGDLAVADLGRSAGYTLRPQGFGIAFCITEEVMDELFEPPFIGSPARERWDAGLREHSNQVRTYTWPAPRT